ncbi:MAG: ABC transporter substrate-binding protein [Spirochaetes bacterium]|nr:ABC transporter substrate-binding protein [Spirochaetota bacterium]
MKKRIMVVFLTILCIAALALVLNGCKSSKSEELTVLFVPGVADPFYFTMERGVKEAAEKYGINLMIAEYPKSWGPEAQVPILEAAAAKGEIDLIITAPTSSDALIAPLKKFYDKGIEIITVDTKLGDGDYSKDSNYSFPLSFIGTDNKAGGVLIAKELGKMLGEKGKVYCMNTNPDTSSVVERGEGFKEGVDQLPNVELVGMDYCLDVQQKAQALTLAALQKDPEIGGIFGVNVFSAQGSYQAVVNAGLTGAVKIASWDATQTLIEALKKGEVDLVLAQKPAEMGFLAVEWGYKYLTNKTKVPKHISTGFEVFTQDNVNNPDMQQYIYQ